LYLSGFKSSPQGEVSKGLCCEDTIAGDRQETATASRRKIRLATVTDVGFIDSHLTRREGHSNVVILTAGAFRAGVDGPSSLQRTLDRRMLPPFLGLKPWYLVTAHTLT
jgi:hypothetical protein